MWQCYFCDGPIDDPKLHKACDACVEKKQARKRAATERARQAARERSAVYVAGSLPRKIGMLIRFEIADRDGSACGLCGGPLDPLKAHVDHVVPISRGGAHEWNNVQLTHPACNMRKGNRA